MMYKATVCSEIRTKQRKTNTMWNVLMLNLMIRRKIARLGMVKLDRTCYPAFVLRSIAFEIHVTVKWHKVPNEKLATRSVAGVRNGLCSLEGKRRTAARQSVRQVSNTLESSVVTAI